METFFHWIEPEREIYIYIYFFIFYFESPFAGHTNRFSKEHIYQLKKNIQRIQQDDEKYGSQGERIEDSRIGFFEMVIAVGLGFDCHADSLLMVGLVDVMCRSSNRGTHASNFAVSCVEIENQHHWRNSKAKIYGFQMYQGI